MPQLSFEDRYEETLKWVEKRRRTIDIVGLEWSDVRQMVLIRVSQQYHLYDPARPYGNWVNRVITNTLANIWRDHLSTWQRPCITGDGGCTENMGGNLCRRTPSGTQCAECPAYREWEARKGSQYAIMQPLPLENHAQEVRSTQSTFVDYDAMAATLHKRMKDRLNRQEWRAYRMLYILHKEPEEVAKALGFKGRRPKGSRMWLGYSAILALRHRLEEIAREEAGKMAA